MGYKDGKHRYITYNVKRNGKLVRKTLWKKLVCKTNFVTYVFLFQEYGARTKQWGSPKIRIQKYQRKLQKWYEHSGITLSTIPITEEVLDALLVCMPHLPLATSVIKNFCECNEIKEDPV